MIESDGKGLVFILSVPRSGSTLLGALVGSQPSFYCPPEPWLLLPLQSAQSGDAIVVSRYEHNLAQIAWNELFDDKTIRAAMCAFAVSAYNSILAKKRRKHLVDKTPRYYQILDYLDLIFPAAVKIWLKRNPLDVIASCKSYWGVRVEESLGDVLSPHSFDNVVGHVKLLSYFHKHDRKTPIVAYEDLVSNPEKNVASICKAAVEEFDSGRLHYAANKEMMQDLKRSTMGDKNILHNLEVHSRSVDNWKSVLTKEEICRSLEVLGKDLFVDLGYGQAFQEALAMVGDRGEHIEPKGMLNDRMGAYSNYLTEVRLAPAAIHRTLVSRLSSGLHSYNLSLEKQLESVKNDKEILQRKVSQLEGNEVSLREECLAASAHLREVEVEFDGLTERYKSTLESMTRLQDEIVVLHSQKNDLLTEVVSVKENAKTLEVAKSVLEERARVLENVNLRLETENGELRAQIVSVEANVNTLETAKSVLEERCQALDEGKHHLELENVNLRSELKSVIENVGRLEAKSASLEQRNGAMEREVKSLQAEVRAQGSKATSNESEKKALEAEVKKLRQSFDTEMKMRQSADADVTKFQTMTAMNLEHIAELKRDLVVSTGVQLRQNEEIALLRREAERREAEVENLKSIISEKEASSLRLAYSMDQARQRVSALEASLSWRMTAPMRLVFRVFEHKK